MNCSKCNTSNPDSARFCAQCGNGLYYTAPAKQSALPGRDNAILLILLAWEMAVRPVIWIFVDKVVIKIWRSTNTGFEEIMKVHKFYNSLTLGLDIFTFLVLIAGIILSRSTLQRIMLVLFTGLLFIMMIIYRILPLFEKPGFENF
ncbi:MAG: zinc ribbon domain-containing protein [Bacteroidia bacterium]|nr:zinc ribbon domain-containing protein [Bacteroidia bacterium]